MLQSEAVSKSSSQMFLLSIGMLQQFVEDSEHVGCGRRGKDNCKGDCKEAEERAECLHCVGIITPGQQYNLQMNCVH